MMKISTPFIAILSVLLLTHSFSNAQTTIAEYELTTDGTPNILDPNVTASELGVGPFNGSIAFGPNGAHATGWPVTSSLDPNYYFEITISPETGYEMNISDVNFGYSRSSTGPLHYELYWSTDGVFANSTLLVSVAIPNNTNPNIGSLTGLDINIPEGETLYLRWYAYEASNPAGTFRLDVNSTNLQVEGTVSLALENTVVYFNETSASVGEGDGTTNIDVSIENFNSTATSVDLVLVSGDGNRINGFTNQTVTFPANSGGNESVTLTLTDDAICEADGELVFELQNATGGDEAMVIAPSQFTLTIEDNDQTANAAYSTDFEDNNLLEWEEGTNGDWTTSTSGAINGTYSMKHNLSSIAGSSSASTSLNALDLTLDNHTTWSFQLKNGSWTTTSSNRFWVYLASSSEELLPTSSTSGYAVGVNMISDNKLLTLYRIDGGSADPVIESSFLWDGGYTVGIEVTRTSDGEWELKYDGDGGLDNLVSAGTAIDDTYTTANYFGPVFEFTSTRAGDLWLDDVSVTQSTCTYTYYSQASGNMTDDIWDVVSAGTPGSAEINRYNDFVIQDGHSVTLNDDIQVSNLDIESGAAFLNDGLNQYSLGLTGSWINNGTFDAGEGSVHFFGTGGPKTITGVNAFFDLEVDLNEDDLTLNDDTDIWGTLLLSNGVINVNGNSLTLKSDENTTAAVGPVNNGSVNGNVTVERYIQNGINSWRNMGASVSGATLEDWNAHFTTTGFPGADFPNWPSAANRFPNIKSYDETDLGDREIGWRAATQVTNSIGDGQGFWMYIGGSELPNTVDATGTLITGENTLDLDYTPSLGAYHDGWNMVSNLYAATIDWDSPEFGRSGLEDGIWIWNQDVQQYGSYISGVGTHAVNNEIAHSQSFWVHANDADPTLTFREGIKTANNNADWIKSASDTPPLVRLKLTGNGFYDETVLVLNENASTGYEGTHDAMKFFSVNEEVPSLATVVDINDEEFDLAINSFYLPEGAALSIPMKALAGANGEYTLSVSQLENVPLSACIYVEDLESGEILIIEDDAEMTITLDTAITEARFMIHISGPVATDKQENTCHGEDAGWLAAQGSGDGPWTYTWTNEQDEVVQYTESTFASDTLNGLSAGSYYVEVSGSADVCGARGEFLTIAEPAAVEANFATSVPVCNEGSTGNISTTLAGGSGEWALNLYTEGEVVEQISTTEASATFNNLAAGNYSITVTNACGTVEETIFLSDENITIADFALSSEEVLLQEGGTVMLTNLSENASLYYLEMGDGTSYFSPEVSHSYTEAGEYLITLHSIGDYCEDAISKTVTVVDNTVNVDELSADEDIQIWFDGQEVIIEHSKTGQEMEIRVMSILGKTMSVTQSFNERVTLPMAGQGYAPGVYFVRIALDNQVKTHKVVLDR